MKGYTLYISPHIRREKHNEKFLLFYAITINFSEMHCRFKIKSKTNNRHAHTDHNKWINKQINEWMNKWLNST